MIDQTGCRSLKELYEVLLINKEIVERNDSICISFSILCWLQLINIKERQALREHFKHQYWAAFKRYWYKKEFRIIFPRFWWKCNKHGNALRIDFIKYLISKQ